MFDFVRSHSRLMLALMVLLIFPSFVFFGVQGYSRFTDPSGTAVAKVDGTSITRAEWDQVHQRQVERLRRQMPTVDAKFFDSPQARRQTLDALVQERVLLRAADRLQLLPGDERLARLFANDPSRAELRNPGGGVNRDVIASLGMSVEAFERQMRLEYGMQQVIAGLRGSVFAPPAVADAALDAFLQRREVQFERFDPAAYSGRLQPDDAELQAWYKAHASRFMSPEQAQIEYLVLDLDTLAKEAAVPEADLKTNYEQNIARYTSPEERRISHILIKADRDAPAAERAKAKARAEALLAELRKNPASFAELARKNSEDSSAAQGGDLDFVTRGTMVKPFEDAAFAMKPGEISNVVETDFGYHILHLAAVRGGEKKPFEAVRAEIEAELRRSQAAKLYAERAVQFSDIVFEQSDSLQPAADKLKLTKRTATVARAPAPGASGPLASPKLLAAIFGNDVLRNKRNTEAVETGPSQMAAARIVKHEPARTLPFDEVKAQVRAAVVAEQAAAMARRDGEAKLEGARADAAAPLASTAMLSRAQTQGLPRQVVEAVLGADAAKLPQALGIDLGAQGYVVARVVKVLPRELPPGSETLLRNQYAAAWSAAESDAYLAALKKRFKVQMKEDAVAAAISAASAAAP